MAAVSNDAKFIPNDSKRGGMPTRMQAALGVALLFVLAGCAGAGGSTATLSEVSIESQYGDSSIEFNATGESQVVAELESPNGTVLSEKNVSRYTLDRFDIPDRPGEYTLRLKENGREVASETVTVEPAQPRVNITSNWNGAELPQALIEVRNEGDLPANTSVTVSHAGEELDRSIGQPIAGGENYTFRMTGLYGSLYEAEDGGTVNLQAEIQTDEQTIERTISHEVAPANLEFEYMRPNWQSNELKTVEHKVRNTGDVTADLDGELTVNGETAIGTLYGDVEGNQSREFTIDHADLIGADYLYKADSGSNTVELTLRYKGGEITTTATDDFESASGDISSVSTSWSPEIGGNDTRLNSVDFNVENTGGVDLSYDSVRVEIEGQTASDDLYSTATIEPNSQKQDSMRTGYDNRPQVEPGDHDLTIMLIDGGQTVAETTTTVTAEG